MTHLFPQFVIANIADKGESMEATNVTPITPRWCAP